MTSLNTIEQTYQVALINNGNYIVTPGKLDFDAAKKKSSYLSQYGQVILLDNYAAQT